MAESDRLIVNHKPVGSIAQLREAGLDPARYGSCSRPGRDMVGCHVYDSCPFGQERYGAFKGVKPKNVGYYIKALSGGSKTDWMTCHDFISSLWARMMNGLFEVMNGRKGEIIRIIGLEGDTIPMKITLPVDSNANKTLNVKIKAEVVDVKIPVFKTPLEADPDLKFEQELATRFPMSAEVLASIGIVGGEDKAALVAAAMGAPEEEVVSPAPAGKTHGGTR
jgi:hypothetical protein